MKPLKKSFVPPEREQHDRVIVEPRAITSTGHVTEHGARIQPAIERYARRGQLSVRQVRAAETLYRAWALGIVGAKLDNPGCTVWSPSGLNDAQVQAARSYAQAQSAVGRHIWPLLFHVVCLDWTADRFGNERGRNATSTMEVLRYGLDMAADAFGIPE